MGDIDFWGYEIRYGCYVMMKGWIKEKNVKGVIWGGKRG